jgi:hypothetical protein
MAPRRPTRHVTAKSEPLGKTKVAKSTNKKATSKKTAAKEQNRPATITKTFACGCADACHFKYPETYLRIILGRPEYNENPDHVCACRVHYKCAKYWAMSHNELPATLPCGCPMTKRGEDFWVAAVVGRKEELKEKKREEMWADVDSGSDLTDLED